MIKVVLIKIVTESNNNFFKLGLNQLIIKLCSGITSMTVECKTYDTQYTVECNEINKSQPLPIICVNNDSVELISFRIIKALLVFYYKIYVACEENGDITFNITHHSDEYILVNSFFNPEARESITDREWDIIHLYHQQITETKISELLDISVKTVFSHKYNIMKKLGFRTSGELYMWIVTL